MVGRRKGSYIATPPLLQMKSCLYIKQYQSSLVRGSQAIAPGIKNVVKCCYWFNTALCAYVGAQQQRTT